MLYDLSFFVLNILILDNFPRLFNGTLPCKTETSFIRRLNLHPPSQ